MVDAEVPSKFTTVGEAAMLIESANVDGPVGGGTLV
jgi:hypothetical protein